MIIKAIIVIVAVVIIALIINAIEDIKRVNRTRMSFKESLDLAEVPIVTFVCTGRKLNFLLDTGSSNSLINKSLCKDLQVEACDFKTDVIGIEGNKMPLDFCKLTLEYKGQHFENKFALGELDATFASVKQATGVQLHGILGSDFFQNYGYILDFSELAAYIK